MQPFFSTKRLQFTLGCALLLFAGLGCSFAGDEFCSERSKLQQIAALVLILIVFEIVSGAVGHLVRRVINGEPGLGWSGPSVAAVLSGLLTFLLPNYLFIGSGSFRFAGTWLDMSCMFREGYMLVFSVLGPFATALLTLVCEILILRRPSPR